LDPSRISDKRLLLEALRRSEAAGRPWRDGLFPEQLAFVDDPSAKKAALCSRRAGKTEGVAAWLLDGAQDSPGALSIYIAKTRNNARLILWNTLKGVEHRHRIGLWFRELDGQLMVQTRNGHRIWLAGCDNAGEVDKFRGVRGELVAGVRRAAIDEAQGYGSYLRTLIDDVLEPALMDQQGELAICGTPGPVPAGLFYEATTGDGGTLWPTHHWTVLTNPYMPHAARWLESKREANHWAETNATYQREWLGRWVRDLGALVYPYDGQRNAYRELPEGQITYGLAVDLGASESERSTAFVVGACRKGHPELYIVHVEKRAALIPSAIAAHVDRLQRQYRPIVTVMDEGALGKGYGEEMRRSYGIAVRPAEKQKKRGYQELVGGDLLSGRIKLNPFACRDLIDEMQVAQWNETKSDVDERFEVHACDAFLYLCRALRPYYRPEIEPPREGSEEAIRLESARRKKDASRRSRELALGRAKRWG
jgi:hypothetical protein